MELFSKRNSRDRNNIPGRWRYRNPEEDGAVTLISDNTRTRLHEQLKFFCSSENYLERGMLVHDENRAIFYLYEKAIVQFLMREAGYNISTYIKLETLEFRLEKNDDLKFFDLIETILIFAKKDQRGEVIKRMNKVFREESEAFVVHGFMVVETEHSGLRSALPLIKDAQLQKSIREYYKNDRPDTQFEVLAKISAGILQRITTSPESKGKTKEYAEELCNAVAMKWTDEKSVSNLASLLSDTIQDAKKLSNNVTDIRHTDKSTIPVDSPKMYKLIASKNINLAELIILTLPERYISEQDPDEMKETYSQDYGVDITAAWRIEKKKVAAWDTEINPDDIPF